MATLIKVSGEVVEVHPAGKVFTLKEMQGYVGGYIEYIRKENLNLPVGAGTMYCIDVKRGTETKIELNNKTPKGQVN